MISHGLRRFDAVVPRRGVHRGRVGMVAEDLPPRLRDVVMTNDPDRVVLVQFGAGGPFQRYTIGGVRRATAGEVRDQGLAGIGMVVRGEET